MRKKWLLGATTLAAVVGLAWPICGHLYKIGGTEAFWTKDELVVFVVDVRAEVKTTLAGAIWRTALAILLPVGIRGDRTGNILRSFSWKSGAAPVKAEDLDSLSSFLLVKGELYLGNRVTLRRWDLDEQTFVSVSAEERSRVAEYCYGENWARCSPLSAKDPKWSHESLSADGAVTVGGHTLIIRDSRVRSRHKGESGYSISDSSGEVFRSPDAWKWEACEAFRLGHTF